MTQPKVDACTREAVDWLLRLEAAGEDRDLRQAFDAW
jgi:transmembrane sensor